MTTSYSIRILHPGVILAVVAVALIFLAQRDTVAAQTEFNPVASATLSTLTPGEPVDIDTELCLGTGPAHVSCPSPTTGDVNFSGIATFIPSEFGVALDADVPDGAILARLSAQPTLGLIGSHCGILLPVSFTMFEATTNTSNIITPLPIGRTDALRPLMEDADGNGIIDSADKYPGFLLAQFDPDWVDAGPDGLSGTSDDNNGPLPPVTPIARQVGATEPTGTGIAVILNFLLFEPGTILPDTDPFPASFGYPSVTVLQDPTVPLSPGAISDFCTPLVTTTANNGITEDNPSTAANEGGISYRTNPSADGFYNLIALARGQRDADGDGHANALDTCPFLPLPSWDPRLPGGGGLDPDTDLLPNDCDPDPATQSPASEQPNPSGTGCEKGNVGPDEDRDCYSNGQDNCPLVPNGVDQSGNPIGANNQEDDDEDGIGDVCDTNPTVPDGDRPLVCTVIPITIGSPSGSAPDLDCAAELACALAGTCDTGDTGGAEETGTQLAEALSATGTQLVVTDATPFSVGDFIQIDDEILQITAIDGNTLTVLRGVRGTTAAAHLSDADILLVTGDTGVAGETGGGAGGPDTGVGSLAPAIASIPGWAAIASGLGGAGILGAIGSFVLRVFRHRRD